MPDTWRPTACFIVKAGNPKHVTGPNSLKGLNVAVQAGTKYEQYLKTLQKKISFTLQSYPGDNDAVAQVLLGRADVVLTQDTSYAFQARAASGQDRRRLHRSPTRTPSASTTARAIRSGRRSPSGLKQLVGGGTLKKLAAKYQIPTSDVK